MITYDQWISETKRALSSRGSELRAIDQALHDLPKASNPVKAQTDLASKVKAWLTAKGPNWKLHARNATKLNGKGTVERLIDDLAKNPLSRQILADYIHQPPPVVLQPKVIVFSGHGSWDPAKDGYVALAANCTMKFYTLNMKTLSDGLGGMIDRGIIAGLEPDQEQGPSSQAPNMRLFPPVNPVLHIRQPDPTTWDVLHLPEAVPTTPKNLQVQIKPAYPGGGSLSALLSLLQPAIRSASSVTLLWAACRAIELKGVGGDKFQVNAMQR